LPYPIEFASPLPFVYSTYLHPTPLQDPSNCLLTTYKQYPWQPQLVPFVEQLNDLCSHFLNSNWTLLINVLLNIVNWLSKDETCSSLMDKQGFSH
jgi:hypothetical protein